MSGSCGRGWRMRRSFSEQDRSQPLAARLPALDAVTFQTQLGSLGDKTRRVRELAADIAATIGGSREEAQRAAQLSKCDLVTAMVGEFPELQGIMGCVLRAADGESHEVATAIREHYLPRAAGDELPATRAGVAVAIADKLDTLAGIFAIGGKPTGTKDPFGLRRAALGLQRILIEKGLDLDLRSAIGKALAAVHGDMERMRINARRGDSRFSIRQLLSHHRSNQTKSTISSWSVCARITSSAQAARRP